MSLSSSTVGGKIKYKIVLLGDQHVGKTSVIERFINNRFQNTYDATIGIDFLVRNLTYQNKHYRLQLWDTAGQERFRSLIPSYLKDSNICLLVYDIGDPSTLEHLAVWQQLYNMHKQYTAFSIAVGNKSDKPNQCSQQLVDETLKQIGVTHHFQISAKTGSGVPQLFHTAIDLLSHHLNNIRIVDQIDQKEEEGRGEEEEAKEKGEGQSVSVSVMRGMKLQENPVIEGNRGKRCC